MELIIIILIAVEVVIVRSSLKVCEYFLLKLPPVSHS